MTAGVDVRIPQQCPNNNSISPLRPRTEDEAISDLVISTFNGLNAIQKEIENYPEESKEYRDGSRRKRVLLDKFHVECRRILGFDKFDAEAKKSFTSRIDALKEAEKKIDDLRWRLPLIRLKPEFKWLKNPTDFSQITWRNVKIFRRLKNFQDIIRSSENEKLIKKTTGRFEKFKKAVDAYKPTFWQKMWQIVTLRFTFIKVDQIRKYLEKDLDIPSLTEAIKEQSPEAPPFV
ncbi:hypothetical protein PHSC3_000390 [Chlamydiales bacterium STE3]|nr:hypothetical protein PHSC3_000390 [Chlamydiales bacterium STE3]